CLLVVILLFFCYLFTAYEFRVFFVGFFCSLFFFVHLLPGLFRSTFFPYTTLFRSYYSFSGWYACITLFPDATESGSNYGIFGTGDRKSTRLNSSHVKISYAVFCVKKKKERT